MARGKKQNITTKVQPNITVQQMKYLEQLVKKGNYGNTPTEVALHLIRVGIDKYIVAKVLK
jgi:hypothetical protein